MKTPNSVKFWNTVLEPKFTKLIDIPLQEWSIETDNCGTTQACPSKQRMIVQRYWQTVGRPNSLKVAEIVGI